MRDAHRPENEKTVRHLEQTMRTHVAQLSTETGLPEPAVDVVPFLKGRTPRINAHFSKPEGVPTITITERAVQELPRRVLRFLLAHEFGHAANWGFRDKGPRRFVTVLLLAAVACVLGAILWITDIGHSIAGLLMLWAGVATLFGSLWVFPAFCRVDEYRADAFAARLTGDLAAARGYFGALGQDRPKGSLGPWSSHPPVPDRLAAVEKILDRKTAQGSAQ